MAKRSGRCSALSQLAKLATSCSDGYFTFELQHGHILVLDAEEPRTSTAHILRLNDIARQTSRDLWVEMQAEGAPDFASAGGYAEAAAGVAGSAGQAEVLSLTALTNTSTGSEGSEHVSETECKDESWTA